MDTTTVIVLGAVVVGLLLLVGAGLALRRLYHVPKSNEAIIRTGGRGPAIAKGAGIFVWPIVHQATRISLEAVSVSIDRTDEDALRTSDKLLADVEGTMLVRVDSDDDHSILVAARSLGEGTAEAIEKLVFEKTGPIVTDAMRSATMKKSFLELNVQKEQFAKEVLDAVADDLKKLGLKLISVTITEVRQRSFDPKDDSVFTAEGRRNAVAVVERARQETNELMRAAEIAVQQQDVEARRRALELDQQKAEVEADQERQVAEYRSRQATERQKAVFLQEQAAAEAEQKKIEAIQKAQIEQARAVREAEIAKETQVALATARAEAEKAKAEAEKSVAETEAHQRRETAEIERQRVVKVAEESREQAIETAEVARQVAVSQKRAEEAGARAQQATAEAEQTRAEQAIRTVEAEAEADRQRRVVTIQAEEEAAKEKIKADRDAYVETKAAEAERTAALERAEAVAAEARGRAAAVEAEAKGAASAKTISAEAYARDLTIRAEAEVAAAEKQADARARLAEALLEEGKARAEAERLLTEARNAVSREILLRDVTVKALEVAPAVVHEVMAPVAKVAHDVKILQVQGLGQGGDGAPAAQGLPATVLHTGLAAAGVLPFLKEALQGLSSSPEVQEAAEALGDTARSVVRDVVAAARVPSAPPNDVT